MKKPPPNSKQKEIMRASIRMFTRRGFYNVSVEDIVRASNTSIATFYSYFPAKEEVVVAFRNEYLARCLKFHRQLMEDEAYAGWDALAKLRALISHVMGLMNKVGAEFGRVFAHYRIREHNAGPDDQPYLEPIMALLALGQQEGCIRRDISVRDLLADTDRMLNGAYLRWQLHQGGHDMEAICADALALYCDFLSPERQRPQTGPRLHEIWETALYMLIPDPRSGIKQLEEDWLGRFAKD